MLGLFWTSVTARMLALLRTFEHPLFPKNKSFIHSPSAISWNYKKKPINQSIRHHTSHQLELQEFTNQSIEACVSYSE